MTDRTLYLPPWRIDVSVRPTVALPLPVPITGLARVASRALTAAGAPSPASLTLMLSDDEQLAALNVKHMGHEGPTDVLSFPMLQPSAFPPHPGQDPTAHANPVIEPARATPPGQRIHLGDIVISVERAIAQANEGRGGQTSEVRWSAADELRLLVAHGVMHVCGWDHASPTEAVEMRSVERESIAFG